jgi:hypothetical protein
MSYCIVKESGLCATCLALGRKTNGEPCRTLDLKELCKTCRRGLRTSYVGVVKEVRKHYAEEEK